MKYETFWKTDQNEQVLRDGLEQLDRPDKNYFVRLTTFVAARCTYPRGRNGSLEVLEVMRKCWEIHPMADDMRESILKDKQSDFKSYYTGIVHMDEGQHCELQTYSRSK